ncbi:COG1470 family protein [Labrys wisconsinensis]|uniref:Membrane protein n=1 Tax=Labrys wisconsinensis TaxID=425677 RepID=A0ABU0JKM3_9HYPH|nr:NEW3 domain-containing protein [Labrys wisconsinensis]MDQ0473687.1 putative membrane protein [Labrys wisconsinensis]
MHAKRRLLCASLFYASALLTSGQAWAATAPDIKGLWLTTDFPSLTLHAGDTTSLGLTLYNYGLAPQRTELNVAEKPQAWSAVIEGQGKPVNAAFADYDGRATLSLKLDIPKDAKPGDYKLLIDAAGTDARSSLPVTVHLEPPLAAKLTAEPKLPVLKGSPKSSFDFSVHVVNDSATDMLATLTAEAPAGFDVAFKEGYGSQELTSIPLKAGEAKDISVSIKPTQDTPAGDYPVTMKIAGAGTEATARLTLDVSGQPSLSLAGEDGRVSGNAYAGRERSYTLVLRNSGTAAARDLSLNGSAPPDWKVSFEPAHIDALQAGAERTVTALVTPAAKALDGDYVVSFSASGDGASQSASYRVTVLTSTLWGATGIGLVAVAALVLVGAVGRYGRR